uniref:Uncharacterized protein n=1 Tax=Anguilla anguilla TaxID=7936 RepID=A0A0E9PVP3_ANGAN
MEYRMRYCHTYGYILFFWIQIISALSINCTVTKFN